jgi:hypothetical protein
LRTVPWAAALALLPTGCADWNDHPAGGMRVIVGFEGLEAPSTGLIQSPSNSNPPILSLVVGAIVIHYDRDPSTVGPDPFTDPDQVDEAAREGLADDAIQSAAYLTIADLPHPEDTISFLIPPATSGPWQLVGVGLRYNIDVLQDLEDKEDAPIWYGFTPEFQNDVVEPGDTVTLTLQPGCELDSPPKPPCP